MSEQDLNYVPGRDHYSLDYLQGGRMFSYAHQLNAIISCAPRVVLEIGAGGGIVTAALRATGIKVITCDVQRDLVPCVVSSVTHLPYKAREFDCTICCQVLEHLPYEAFEIALRELRRVTTGRLVMSIPDVTRGGFLSAKLPGIPSFSLEWSYPKLNRRPMPRKRYEDCGHFWEVGFQGYSLTRILSSIEASGWRLCATWRVHELRWHRFFNLE